MPNAGAIIGRVAVKVLPDTSDFRRDLQRKLDALEKKLTVELPTTADMTGAKRDLLEGLRKLNAENRAKDSRKVQLSTTLSTSTTAMRTALNRTVRKYEDLSHTNQVKLDTSLVAADLELKLDEENLKKVEEELDHWRRSVSPIEVPVHTDVNGASTKGSAAKLTFLSRARIVDLVPKVDARAAAAAETALAALSGSRLLSSTFDRLRNMFRDLDKDVPLIGSIALAIAGVASWSATAAANLFALSASLAQIAGAGLALPGILGGIAVGLTTTLVAFKDINKVVPEVKQAWNQIRGTISQNFWDEAAAPIRDMVDQLLPEFVSGFAGAATTIGSYWGSLAHDLAGAFNGPVAGMFDDLNQSVQIATTGTGSLAGLITTLGRAGASQLPRLAKWFVSVTDRMDAFFAEAAQSGKLDGWINNGIEQLKALGQALKNLGSIFAGLSKAMTNAGGSTLSVFAVTLKKVAAVVNSPGFQSGMTEVFAAAFQAMHAIATEAGPAVKAMFTSLGQTLTAVLPVAGHAIGVLADALARLIGSNSVQTGLKAMFDGLDSAITSLAPAIRGLTPVLGQLGQLFGQMASSFGPLLAAAFRALTPVAISLMKAIEPVVRILAGGLTAAINGIAPLLRGLAPVIAALVTPLLLVAGGLKAAAVAAALFGTEGKITGAVKAMKTALVGLVTQTRLVVAGFRDARVAESAFSGGAGTFGGWLRTYGKGVGIISALAAGVTALGFGIAKLLDGNHSLSASFKEVDDAAKSWTQSLVAANGALDKSTKLAVGAQLQQDGLAKKAQAAGISLSQLIAGVTGSDAAFKQLNETWKAQGKPSSDTLFQLSLLHGAYAKSAADAKALAAAVAQQGSGAKAGAAANMTLGNISEVTAAKQAHMKSETDRLSGSLKQAALSGQALSDAIDKIDGSGIAAAQAQISFRNSLASVTQSVKENGNALKGNTAAALANRGAILDSLQAAKDHAKAMVDEGKSAGKVKKALADDVKALIDQAKHAGLSKAAVRDLVQSMGLLPGQIQKSLGATKDVGSKAGKDTVAAVSKAINSKTPDVKRAGEAAGKAADAGVTKGVHDNIGQVTSTMTTVAATIRNSTSNWSTLLYSAGALVMDGLISGIESKRGALQAKLGEVTSDIPKYKGPKEVDKKLLYKAGKYIMDGLIKGIASRYTTLRDNLKTVTTEIGKITDDGLQKTLGTKAKKLKLDLIDWQSTQAQLQQAKDALKGLADEAASYREQIKSSLISEGDITQSTDDNGKTTFGQIKDDLTTAVQRAEHFQSVLAKLKKLGLNSTALDQLAQAGAENGTASADALLKAGKSGIRQINQLDSRLNKAAGGAAQTATDAMYQAGLQSAQGLVDGLKKSQDKLDKQMEHLANTMVRTIKKKLDIHSPSRVMHEIGRFTGLGILSGLESTYKTVQKSLSRFGDKLSDTELGSPTIAVGAQLNGIASNSLANGSTIAGAGDTKVLNYYAAPNSSLSSEEDLFAAARRSRFAW